MVRLPICLPTRPPRRPRSALGLGKEPGLGRIQSAYVRLSSWNSLLNVSGVRKVEGGPPTPGLNSEKELGASS
jgi:hypothetical protein